ncbi:MAG: HD domain-containing protein [Oscillochloris sp.]|nr:HD domain-containing protein [Oscillochloris sp.]
MPDLAGAAHYARERLKRELSPHLTYHSLTHTCDDVVVAATYLAQRLGLVSEVLLLVQTAAWYHDIGFVIARHNHETHSIAIAAEMLPVYGYCAAQINEIAGMIAATRIPQMPQTISEQVVADADLDVLGRADFAQRNQALRAETAAYLRPMGDAEWYAAQFGFLRAHTYWTAAARKYRDAGKRRNIDLLQTRLLAAGGA